MAVLVRTTQAAEFVCVHDPDAHTPTPRPDPWPSPDPDWLPAAGQPSSATRFRVRPLSPAEYEVAAAALQDRDTDAFDRACLAGLVAIDGEPASAADLTTGWQRTIASLVSGLTALPMRGLISRSKAGQSTASTDGA